MTSEGRPARHGACEDARVDRDTANGARFVPGTAHYESWFARANHPSEPRSFWIRYTIFSPAAGPPVGELWAIVSDPAGVVAVREEHPIERCSFAEDRLAIAIDRARHDDRSLEGSASHAGHTIAWSLRFESPSPPALMMPRALYSLPIPRAKALTGSPLASFDGTIELDGQRLEIDRWLGSQCHNWGARHTTEYAWGQVCGFDGEDDTFLELTTARIAPRAPRTTIALLRRGDQELRFDGVLRALRARAEHAPFRWTFDVAGPRARLHGVMEASPSAFVALPYGNPPGGTKWCLNSKIASCAVTLEHEGRTIELGTKNRAAFELLSDAPPPPGLAQL